MKSIVVFFLAIIFTTNIQAQANDAEALVYNLSIGSVFSTVGALINKKPQDKVGKIVIKGLAQGALGGLVAFGSKSLLREAQRQEDWKYIWGAKLANSAATSIKENAALNRDFWEYWQFTIGFNRIEFETKNKLKVHYKLMPIALGYTIGAFIIANFDINTSLKTGEFVFYKRYTTPGYAAFTFPGYILYNQGYFEKDNTTDAVKFRTITHEIVHLYQGNDYNTLNTYIQKPINYLSKSNKTVHFLDKLFYLDLQYIPIKIIYNLQHKITNINDPFYYKNIFEHEAGYFSNTLR